MEFVNITSQIESEVRNHPVVDVTLSIILHNATAIPLGPTYHAGLEERCQWHHR